MIHIPDSTESGHNFVVGDGDPEYEAVRTRCGCTKFIGGNPPIHWFGNFNATDFLCDDLVVRRVLEL